MSEQIKRRTKLLTRVPKDIMDMVKGHQENKKLDCGCRFGFEQALYDLLRKAYGQKK